MGWKVRAYAPADREGVRAVAADTAWLGGPGGDAIPDPWVWSELTTRYFTDREPEHALVVAGDDDHTLGGFLLATADVARYERFLPTLAPGLFAHATLHAFALRRATRRAMISAARSLILGELVVPPKVRAELPATFRFAMRDEARGQGLGAILLSRALEGLRAEGVRGVHAQTLSIHEDYVRILRRAGFQLAASWPLGTFAHVESRPIDLLTWVLPLAI